MSDHRSTIGSAIAIDAATRLAAVIGAPVAHSHSPAIHNAGFSAAGIDAVYLALRVQPEDLSAAVRGFRALRALGVSVTVPHKCTVAPLCDRIAPPADAIGAVNCLVFEQSVGGVRVIGHNTDAGGFVDSLRKDRGWDPAGKRVVLLGAGGAARALYVGLRSVGADITAVIARTPRRATWVEARPWTERELRPACEAADLLVDCTTVALSPETEARIPCGIPVRSLQAHALVASLVYHREPALLAAARARGLATLDGAGMLVHQGARAFELWTGVSAPVEAMWQAMRELQAMGVDAG